MDKDKAIRNLEEVLEKIHSDTDIAELQEYQKIFKKEVSFFRRSWAAAWLLMYYDKRETPAKNVSEKKEIKRPGKQQEKKKQESNLHAARGAALHFARSVDVSKPAPVERQPLEINLSEEESKRLFISIGKNRKLFPREVIGLIMSKTSTPREDIGLIRILDNYSFVQVRDTKADEIIKALTGVKFRGRTLSVNYAKPKATETEE